jgi:hypothetical protein
MSANPQLDSRRQAKDRFLKSHPQSPLTPEQRALFQGLRYFEFNPDLQFELKPEPFTDKANVKIQTTTGESRFYLRWGTVKFPVQGETVSLTLFLTPGSDEFFVLFTDATSGTESYGAGRYIEAERLPNGNIVLDFNDAYSPYCAYNEPEHLAQGREPRVWSCPIPPAENRLTVPIRAGEMKPVGGWLVQDY